MIPSLVIILKLHGDDIEAGAEVQVGVDVKAGADVEAGVGTECVLQDDIQALAVKAGTRQVLTTVTHLQNTGPRDWRALIVRHLSLNRTLWTLGGPQLRTM